MIAEALRADRLPAHGYLRPTTPFLTADAQHWITFEHAYSHASRTADSFPVIFNSQYLAAIERTNDGARALWSSLRAADVQTAFVSAAPLEWGALTHAVDYADVDHGWTATNAQSAERVRLTDLSFDYAVDDALPLKTYRELMTTDLRHRRSFVTLHLVGSHFPFNYQDTADTFFPNIKRPEATAPSAARPLQMYELRSEATQQRLNEIGNSYDNSIRHIDGAVRQAIQVLADLEILEDSVVILTSDHGESLGEHSTLFHGQTLYEEQVHVPLMMRVGRIL
ncbi:MAG: sulfatase-like hydrolase/transferase [Vicinamibacterales bacterium]